MMSYMYESQNPNDNESISFPNMSPEVLRDINQQINESTQSENLRKQKNL